MGWMLFAGEKFHYENQSSALSAVSDSDVGDQSSETVTILNKAQDVYYNESSRRRQTFQLFSVGLSLFCRQFFYNAIFLIIWSIKVIN